MSLRPAILDPLFAPATALPGVGPKIEQLLDRLVGEPGRPARIVDLLFHLPHGGISRELKGSIAEAPVGETVTLKVRVTEHRPGPPRRGKAPFRILVEDDTGDILLVFFNAHPERIQALLPVGSVRYVSGKIEIWDGYRQMVHPDRILDERRIGELPAVEAVYGLTEGLSTRLVGKFVGAALARVPALPEWQEPAWLEQSRFPAFGEALHQLHRPAAAADVSPEAGAASPAWRRLAYDELLASQLALLAMASAIEAGRQAALMAPTEILARQHFERIEPLARKAGLRLALLTGRDKGAERRRVLLGLADGAVDVVVGTHALFQEDVVFRDLGLAVVDEQHRFGVHQRLALGQKGEAVDILVMTATPIPRTLALTYFGDMDVSVLDEKPPGRKPIATRLVSTERLREVADAIGRAIKAGDRVYWICPLVAESEAVDLAAAGDRYAELRSIFGEAVGLVHGKLAGREKDAAMARFAAGETAILVATMVIEHAERFGLAQLHQLRGRIGRGERASTCLLLYKGPLGPMAKARLEMMRETEDGFRIAEEDLRLRGEGEILGT